MKSSLIEVDLTSPRLGLEKMKSFAQYLMGNIDAYTEEWLRQTRLYDTPMLRHLSQYPDDQLLLIGKQVSVELLQSLIEGKPDDYIRASVQRWIENQLPLIEQNQIAVDDVYLFPHIRKQTLLTFVSTYTIDAGLITVLIREIDEFTLAHTATSFKTFVKLIEDRMAIQMKKLSESENLLKQAQAITHIGNFVWDLINNKINWTDELYRIYGLPPGSPITNEFISSFSHPEDALRIHTAIQHTRDTQIPFDFYYRIILPNGEQKTLRAKGQIICDEANEPVSMFGTAQDVTQQKQTEEELLQNQRFIKRIADAAPSLITLYNNDTLGYTFVNDGLMKLLGYEPKDALEGGVAFMLALIHPVDLEKIQQQRTLQQVTECTEGKSEEITEYQYRIKHHDGRYRWFRTYDTVFDRDEAHRPVHMLNISVDITDKVESEHILLQRSVELSQSNSRLEEFAFIASHDLKEPLRKITLFSDRLRKLYGDEASEEAKLCVDKIFTSAERLQSMVGDLLGIAQVSGEKGFEPQDLQKIFNEVVTSLEHKIEEVKAHIVTDKLPVATVISGQFRHLFLNLVNNALKFVRSEVQPELNVTHCYLTAEDVRSWKLTPAMRYLKIVVADNGIGFDNSLSEKIFGIFQRLHPRSRIEGAGMGLAICKKIVENHGGCIFASGKEGHGATFFIIIPDNAP
jgi:PAS domain S-box-containing protein